MARRLRLVELLAGLSRIADLGFGLRPGESLRSAVLALRMADRLDLEDDELVRAVLYTCLLHHLGCIGYAHETARTFGDERAFNRAAARSDHASPVDLPRTFLPTLVAGQSPLRALRMLAAAVRAGDDFGDGYTTATCEVGAQVARRLGLTEQVQQAVFHVYELWQGGGAPVGLAGEAIPLAARLARLSGIATLFDTLGGPDEAVRAVDTRAGGMLDPTLAAIFVEHAHDLMAGLDGDELRAAVLAGEPDPVVGVLEPRLVDVARVFGELVDLKAPWFHGHSRGVALLAGGAGEHLGLDRGDIADLEVAGLLHDVGRVAVPNRVWEHDGPLDGAAWEEARLHPYHSERVLAGSRRLAPLAPVVGMHHERLDGSGYHRGVRAPDLPTSARILAAADVYRTKVEPRPHRDALAPDAAADHLRDGVRDGLLDADAVRGVLAAAGHEHDDVRRQPPAGLTEREVDVLVLVAAGCSNADIAERLVISRRTAEHHVQHLYAKIGTSSRAAAAVFAMEHDLV